MTARIVDPSRPKRQKTGGRTKGTPNRKSLLFRDRLASVGCDIESELAKAILGRDVIMIQALASLLPYLTPRLKESELPAPPPPEVDAGHPTSELVSIVLAK